jgi:hypothetical protein
MLRSSTASGAVNPSQKNPMLTSVQIERQRNAHHLASRAFARTAESTVATESYFRNNIEQLRAAGFTAITIPLADRGRGLSDFISAEQRP